MLTWLPFSGNSFSERKKAFLEKVRDWIVMRHQRTMRKVQELKRWENPEKTSIWRSISRLLFVTSLVVGLFGLFNIVINISSKSSQSLNRTGILLQIIATLSLVPEILREQDNENLQNLIRRLSKQLEGRINVRKIWNEELFLLVEQNGAFGFINLVGQTWFALTFLFNIGPATLAHSGGLVMLLYYISLFLWIVCSVIYWGAKYYNLPLPDWIAGSNFLLNLCLIPGPVLTFSFVALIVWLIIELLNWLSQFEIKKVFVIVTIPLLLLGMLLQFIAA
jgi:hypothetical protein